MIAFSLQTNGDATSSFEQSFTRKIIKAMKLHYFILSVVFLFAACKKDDGDAIEDSEQRKKNCPPEYVKTGVNAPFMHDTVKYQIDSFNNLFATRDYRHLMTLDEPSSGQSIMGKVVPCGELEVVYERVDGNLPFAKSGETIDFKKLVDVAKWSNYGVTVISNHGCYGAYLEKWIIEAETTNPFYVLFRTKNETKFGWIKISADEETGEFEFLDHHVGISSILKLP
ncbi:MAG: hypothetical protein KDC92_00295 [Bacteroidetes bacterium]|nr:hypothetical protein [Bacteroidota bacterium]